MPPFDRKIKIDEVLRQLSRDIGAEFVQGPGFELTMFGLGYSFGKVDAHVGPWTIRISSYAHQSRPRTEIYTPYLTSDGFRFSIQPAGVLENLVKKLGLFRNVDVGFPEFDKRFFIKGNDKPRVRTLFADPKFRALIPAQPMFVMQVWDGPWSFKIGPAPFHWPENLDVLVLEVPGAIEGVGQLRMLFDMFIATLEQLCQLGVARKEPTGVKPWGRFRFSRPKLDRPRINPTTEGPA